MWVEATAPDVPWVLFVPYDLLDQWARCALGVPRVPGALGVVGAPSRLDA